MFPFGLISGAYAAGTYRDAERFNPARRQAGRVVN